MSMSPGAFRANTPPMDPSAMERDLARIPAVSSARVVIEDDELREVHVVSGGSRSPKLIGRDVQSLLAAQWGIDVDHRKVSVVQLDDGDDVQVVDEPSAAAEPAPAPPTTSPAARAPAIVGLGVSLSGHQAQATITVQLAGRTASATVTGAPSWAGQRRIAADATLQALAQLDGRFENFVIDDLSLCRIGDHDVVVATCAGFIETHQTTVAGASPVGAAGELRAAADAVLGAFRF